MWVFIFLRCKGLAVAANALPGRNMLTNLFRHWWNPALLDQEVALALAQALCGAVCFSSCVLCWALSSLGPVLSFTGFLHIKGAFPPSTGFPLDVGWSPSLSFLAIFSN